MLRRDSEPLNTSFLFSFGPLIFASADGCGLHLLLLQNPPDGDFLLLPFLNTLSPLFISSVSYLCLYGFRHAYFVPWTVAPNSHDLFYRSDFPTFLPLATPSGWFFVSCQMTQAVLEPHGFVVTSAIAGLFSVFSILDNQFFPLGPLGVRENGICKVRTELCFDPCFSGLTVAIASPPFLACSVENIPVFTSVPCSSVYN